MAEEGGNRLADALNTVDAYANQVVEESLPLRFALAQTEIERQACYRLRYIAVMERGWAGPDDFPDGLEYDAFDDSAVHICGWDGSRLVATGRLILPEPGRRLPVEQAFDLDIEPRGQVAYISRFVVTRSHSTPRHAVLNGLLASAWLALRRQGLSVACGTATPAMLRLYRRAGIELETLGPLGPYWGEQRFPVRFDLHASLAAALERRGRALAP